MIGIYPGSFDPLTLGHLDVILKAKKACSHLIIAISTNLNKKAFFSPEERKEMVQKTVPDVEIIIHNGLIVDLIKEKKASFLIRGLRSTADFDSEYQMAEVNRLLGGVETLFFMGSHAQISATLIREIAHFKGPLHNLVPKEIEPIVRKKFIS